MKNECWENKYERSPILFKADPAFSLPIIEPNSLIWLSFSINMFTVERKHFSNNMAPSDDNLGPTYANTKKYIHYVGRLSQK